jgi:hypothetical protein
VGKYPQNVYVVPKYAYLTNGEDGLVIINVTDKTNPKIISTQDTPGFAVNLTVNAATVYIADGRGLEIIDVSDPQRPFLMGGCPTPGWAHNVCVVDNYAYVADSWAGLKIFNISSPARPAITGSFWAPK